MDQVETSSDSVPNAIQIADAVKLFDEALEMSGDDWAAAEELFEKSFDGMVELARSGDTTAQYNVALMYGLGINEPYDEDIDLLMEWVQENEKELRTYLVGLEDHIQKIEAQLQSGSNESAHIEASHESGSASSGLLDHDKEAKKLRRLYEVKMRLERQGIRTGANRDEYHEACAD